jgi:tRNA(fMet)-specific endonuclease VapC
MSFYILDTDHVSLLLQGNQAVISKVAQVYPNLAITIVTVQEIFNGWVGGQMSNRAETYAKAVTLTG